MIRKPKGVTAKRRATKKRRKQVAAQPVYDHVTKRDPICRGCSKNPTTQRHHMEGRDVPETVHNVCGVCDDCHDDIHVRLGGKRLKITGDAEERDGLLIYRRFGEAWALILTDGLSGDFGWV